MSDPPHPGGWTEVANVVPGHELTVVCADGTNVSIPPGKSKYFIWRKDNKFHLLDCHCELCLEASS